MEVSGGMALFKKETVSKIKLSKESMFEEVLEGDHSNLRSPLKSLSHFSKNSQRG